MYLDCHVVTAGFARPIFGIGTKRLRINTGTKESYMMAKTNNPGEAGFGYDNSVSLQTDDVGHLGAAVSAHVACVVGL